MTASRDGREPSSVRVAPAKRDVSGIVLLDKPQGLTSNASLQRVKRLYRAAKAGHTGSLDPLATGMLPICLGAATKLAPYLLDARKTYRAVCRLGIATSTLDAEGEVVERRDDPASSRAAVEAALARFTGELEQVPPMHSALKRDGKPLYVLARRGEHVERAPRRIRVYAIACDAYEWPELGFTVTCSKGTYVRTLAADIAAALGTVGHLAALRRLAVAPFSESQLVSLETLAERAEHGGVAALDRLLLPPGSALAGWPSVVLGAGDASRLVHGQTVAARATAGPHEQVAVYAPAGELIAIARVTEDGGLAPRRVLAREALGAGSRLRVE